MQNATKGLGIIVGFIFGLILFGGISNDTTSELPYQARYVSAEEYINESRINLMDLVSWQFEDLIKYEVEGEAQDNLFLYAEKESYENTQTTFELVDMQETSYADLAEEILPDITEYSLERNIQFPIEIAEPIFLQADFSVIGTEPLNIEVQEIIEPTITMFENTTQEIQEAFKEEQENYKEGEQGDFTEDSEEIMTYSYTYGGTTTILRVGDVLTKTVQSHYCACSICCGDKSVFTTKGGVTIWNGMEDPHIVGLNWLPLGSKLLINGEEYTVADTGSALRIFKVGGVDVFVPEGHSACFKLGIIRDAPITILRIGKE